MQKEDFLPVKGGRIWYKMEGKGGVPLLIIHGGPGATHYYLDNLLALAKDRTVIMYDQLGCGKSDRPDDPSLWNSKRFVQEMRSLIDHLELDRYHILGQSWGTMLTILYAQKHGLDGISSMVLSAPYLDSDAWVADQKRHVEDLPAPARKVIQECEKKGDCSSKEYNTAMWEFYRRHLCRLPVWPDMLERSFQEMGMQVYKTMWGVSEFNLTGNLIGADVTPFLRKIDVPVLYTCGEFDESTPLSTKRYKGMTPGSRIKIFEGTSHMHHLEAEADYIHTIREFLKSNDS